MTRLSGVVLRLMPSLTCWWGALVTSGGRPDPWELEKFWHDVLDAEGLPEEYVEEGHEDDVLLDDLEEELTDE